MKLHLFCTKPLVQKLASGAVDSELQAYYVIANLVFYTLLYYSGLAAASSLPLTVPSLLELVVVLAVSVFGVFQAYEASGGKGGRSFLVDFTCLFVPVSITTYLPTWLAYWAVRYSFTPALISLSESHMQFAVNLSRIGTDFFGLLGFAATVGGHAISYWRVVHLMRQVTGLRNGA